LDEKKVTDCYAALSIMSIASILHDNSGKALGALRDTTGLKEFHMAAVLEAMHENPAVEAKAIANVVDAVAFDGLEFISINRQTPPLAKEDSTVANTLNLLQKPILEIHPEDLHLSPRHQKAHNQQLPCIVNKERVAAVHPIPAAGDNPGDLRLLIQPAVVFHHSD
jgi:hypothetical protein